MAKKNKIIIAAMAAVIILAAAFAGTALANPAERLAAGTDARTVSVSGNAQVTLKPDIAFLNFGTQNRGADVAAARDANNKLMEKVFAALKAKGVDMDKDVKTINFSVSPIYDETGKKVTEYQIDNSIQVKVRNLDKLGEIMEAATAAGANTAGGLYFDVEDREGAYNQALTEAIKNARMRAETLAKSAGTSLGAVVSATENGSYYPYYPPIYYGRDYAMDGGVPVSSGSLQVSAAVSVTFELR